MTFTNLKTFQDHINKQTKNILKHINANSEDYYCIGRIEPKITAKWKKYLYLRKCVLDYRNGNVTELQNIIHFLEANDDAKEWFCDNLLTRGKKNAGDEWGSGEHEWLERCLTIDVLKRSAGIINTGKEEVEELCTRLDCYGIEFTYRAKIDWLFIQANLRSPTKYILFCNDENTIEHGHSGAVKNLDGKFETIGSPHFHKHLKEAYKESTSLGGFVSRIRKVFMTEIQSGKKKVEPSLQEKRVISGAKTNNATDINAFMATLKQWGYDFFNNKLKATKQIVTKNGTLRNSAPTSIASVLTDLSEYEDSDSEHDIVDKEEHEMPIRRP